MLKILVVDHPQWTREVTTNERFNLSGKIPCFIDVLKISVMTGANSNAKVLRILLGIMSGPGDLVVL